MTPSQDFFLWLAALAAVGTFLLVALNPLIGHSPAHCRYLVPVQAAPGIYACSEYPHAMRKP